MKINITLLDKKDLNYISNLEVIFGTDTKYQIEIMTSWIVYSSMNIKELKEIKTRQLIHNVCSQLALEIERKIKEKTS